jgi:hypothetical protein
VGSKFRLLSSHDSAYFTEVETKTLRAKWPIPGHLLLNREPTSYHASYFLALLLLPLLPFWTGPGCPGQSSCDKVEHRQCLRGLWSWQVVLTHNSDCPRLKPKPSSWHQGPSPTSSDSPFQPHPSTPPQSHTCPLTLCWALFSTLNLVPKL